MLRQGKVAGSRRSIKKRSKPFSGSGSGKRGPKKILWPKPGSASRQNRGWEMPRRSNKLGWEMPRRSNKLSSRIRRWFAAAALVGVFALGSSGCGHLNRLEYSDLHRLVKKSTVNASASAAAIVPGGKSLGGSVSENLAKMILGENPADVIAEAKSKSKLSFSSTGMPVSTDFWFKSLGLNPGNPPDKPKIEFVESVARKTKLFPEEVLLVLGANAPYSVKYMEEKIKTMRMFLANTSQRLTELEADAERLKPKLGKRADVHEQIRKVYKSRDRVAVEFVALQALLELKHLDPDSFDAVKAVVLKKFDQQACRRMLDLLE